MSKVIYVRRVNCRPYEEFAVGDTETISVYVRGKENLIEYYDENDNLTEYDISDFGVTNRNKKIAQKIHEITGLTVYYIIDFPEMTGTSNFQVCRFDGENYNEYDFVYTLNKTTIVEKTTGEIFIVNSSKIDFSVLENIEEYSIDIQKNVEKLLFESEESMYKIAKETGIAQTTLSRFKRKESDIENMSLKNANKLNEYYLKSLNTKEN